MRGGGAWERFGDAVSCSGVCRERDGGRDVWRDEERDEMDEMIDETHSLVKTR